MQNSDIQLHSDRIRIIIEDAHFLILDRFDGCVIGDGNLDRSHFQINVQPEARNLGIATEACHLLLTDYFKERPITSSFSVANLSAIALSSKLGFEPISNARNTVTVSCRDRHHSRNHEHDLVQQQLEDLGITAAMLGSMPRHQRSCRLQTTGQDVFSRPCRMHPATWDAFHRMVNAAYQEGIQLEVVSAYRDYAYQADLIRNKLDKGQDINDILKVNAAPGYSEHHTGRALDLTTPGFEPLTEDFETSPAFAWLQANAQHYGFTLSYPRDNADGIIYEPWHWCHQSLLTEIRDG